MYSAYCSIYKHTDFFLKTVSIQNFLGHPARCSTLIPIVFSHQDNLMVDGFLINLRPHDFSIKKLSFGSVDPQKTKLRPGGCFRSTYLRRQKNIKVVHSSTAARAGSSVDDFIVWDYLVGGFNPSEKYSQNGNLPQIFGVKKKSKPPPFHHDALSLRSATCRQ